MRLVVATRNPGKLREVRHRLAREGIEVVGLADLPSSPEVDEDGDTFAANARKKAWALAETTGLPVLADDSGLEVDALGGRPGVRSARFAGPDATDDDNNRRLLDELRGVAPEERTAAFVCAMVLAVPGPGGGERWAEGRLEGRILERPQGEGGFGYDPLFWVDEVGKTLAEMGPEEKNRISHRGRALENLLPALLAWARQGR
ncbi:MAG: XTP/dITP diphosphatase [Deferrisomatales bacterium]